MRYARDTYTGKDVDAHSLRLVRKGNYKCPVCHAPVHYRTRIGPSEDPGFAHNAHAGDPSCENYFPGGWASPSPAPTSPKRIILHQEDVLEELSVDIDYIYPHWSLSLRIPEIAKDRAISLSSLLNAFLDVYADQERITRISALDMRTGVGSARVSILPSTKSIRLQPSGKWPPSLQQRYLNATCRALCPFGTLFRRRKGDWYRLRENSSAQWGEPLLVIADQKHSPPGSCVLEAGDVLSSKYGAWKIWKVQLPATSTTAVDQWLQGIGHGSVPYIWQLTALSIPAQITTAGEQKFPLSAPIVFSVTSPKNAANVTIKLSIESNSFSQPLSSATQFVSVRGSTETAAQVEIICGAVCTEDFRFVSSATKSTFDSAVAAIPRLRLSINGKTYAAWIDRSIALDPAEIKSMHVDLGTMTGRANLTAFRCGKRAYWTSISEQRIQELLPEVLKASDSVLIDAGGLGKIEIVSRFAPKSVESRTEFWLGVAAKSVGGRKIHMVSPYTARVIMNSPARSAAFSSNPALLSQLRTLGKHRGT